MSAFSLAATDMAIQYQPVNVRLSMAPLNNDRTLPVLMNQEASVS
ncbi:MAG TPA: hypothetical protein VH088_12345 [Terriglobales bacterium]|nr:hypothetical protein [Terriglobales bacterium]